MWQATFLKFHKNFSEERLWSPIDQPLRYCLEFKLFQGIFQQAAIFSQ